MVARSQGGLGLYVCTVHGTNKKKRKRYNSGLFRSRQDRSIVLFTRQFVERLALAHMLDRLSSQRAVRVIGSNINAHPSLMALDIFREKYCIRNKTR